MRDIYQWIQGVIASPKISKESARRLEEIQCHHGYAERGYSDPESGLILTGNWNNADVRNPHYQEGKHDASQPYWIKADDYVHRVAKVLEERYGAELEWSDEWSECSDCNKLVRNQADSYCWQPSYFDLEGERICHECIENHAEWVFESIEGNPRKALTRDLGLKPEEYGYVKILDKLENGLHEHMASDPKVIAKELKKLGVEKFIFMIDETSQFYITFSCWVHEDELAEIGRSLWESEKGALLDKWTWDMLTENAKDVWREKALATMKTDADVSPAELCKRALQQASAQSAALAQRAKEGVVYSSIQGDGTAKTTVLKHADIRRCPSLIMLPSHYNEDGSCKCEK